MSRTAIPACHRSRCRQRWSPPAMTSRESSRGSLRRLRASAPRRPPSRRRHPARCRALRAFRVTTAGAERVPPGSRHRDWRPRPPATPRTRSLLRRATTPDSTSHSSRTTAPASCPIAEPQRRPNLRDHGGRMRSRRRAARRGSRPAGSMIHRLASQSDTRHATCPLRA